MTSHAGRIQGVVVPLLFAALAAGGCSSGDDGGMGGAGGGSGTGGGGNATAGASGGAGTGGSVGSAGSGGSVGSAGSGGSVGSAGSSGSSGSAGSGGSVGSAGSGGSGGSSSGAAGSAGRGGSGGGAAGSAGRGGGGGGTAGAGGGAAGGTGGASAFMLTSTAFANQPGCGPMTMASACATFPVKYTSFGDNVSPPMSWTGAPAGTMSFVILMQDLTNGMAHWVLWNIPASVTMLAENVDKTDATPPVPAGSQQCSIGQGDGYFGSGACGNVYEYVVYALSIPTFSPTSPTSQAMVRTQLQALGASILGTASIRGRSAQPQCGG